MKKNRHVALVGLLLCGARSNGQMLYEPFDQPTGALNGNVNGMTGQSWGICNGTADMSIASPNLPAATGMSQPTAVNSVLMGGAGSGLTAAERMNVGYFNSGDLYYSFKLRINDISGANTGNGAFVTGFNGLKSSTTDNVGGGGARLLMRRVGTTQFELGCWQDVNANVGSAVRSYDTTHVYDQANGDVFVVMRYRFNPGSSTDDEAALWVFQPSGVDRSYDPSLFGKPDAPAPDATSSGGDVADATTQSGFAGLTPFVQSFFLRQNGSAANTFNLDDVRVDRSWAQVTPPTGPGWMGASGSLWGDSGNWNGGVPNTGSFATFDNSPGPAGPAQMVGVSGAQTTGTLVIKTVNGFQFVQAGGTGGSITFDGGTGTTTHGTSAINVIPVRDNNGAIVTGSSAISVPLRLNNSLEVNVGTSQTLGITSNITESSGSALTKNGGGILNLSGSNSYSGDTTIGGGTLIVTSSNNLGNESNAIILSLGALQTNGAVTTTRNITITPSGGTINTNGSDSSFGNLTIGTLSVSIYPTYDGVGSTLNKDGEGRLSVSSLHGGIVRINAGQIQIAGARAASHASVVNGVTVAGTGDAWTSSLDLGANDLIIDYSPIDQRNAATSPLQTVKNQIKSGFAGGAWNGNGITSSAAASAATTAHPRGLGYAEASTLNYGSLDGTSLTSTMLVVRYTSTGDATLDGTVNSSDFNRLAANFGKSNSSLLWGDGDFNYDGTVNALDFNALATNFGQILASDLPQSAIGALVPEPTAAVMGILGVLLVSLVDPAESNDGLS